MMSEPLSEIKQAEKDRKRLEELESRLEADLIWVNNLRENMDLNKLEITEIENSYRSYGGVR